MIHIELENKILYYLRVDNNLICLGEEFLRAVEILVKLFYAFDLDYPQNLNEFYNFLASYILKVSQPSIENKKIFSMLQEFDNIDTDTENEATVECSTPIIQNNEESVAYSNAASNDQAVIFNIETEDTLQNNTTKQQSEIPKEPEISDCDELDL